MILLATTRRLMQVLLKTLTESRPVALYYSLETKDLAINRICLTKW